MIFKYLGNQFWINQFKFLGCCWISLFRKTIISVIAELVQLNGYFCWSCYNSSFSWVNCWDSRSWRVTRPYSITLAKCGLVDHICHWNSSPDVHKICRFLHDCCLHRKVGGMKVVHKFTYFMFTYITYC